MKLHTAIVILLLAAPLLAVYPVLVLLLWSAGCPTPFSYAHHTLASLPVMLIRMRQHNDAVEAAAVAGEPAPELTPPAACDDCGQLNDAAWADIGGSWHTPRRSRLTGLYPEGSGGRCGVCFHRDLAPRLELDWSPVTEAPWWIALASLNEAARGFLHGHDAIPRETVEAFRMATYSATMVADVFRDSKGFVEREGGEQS